MFAPNTIIENLLQRKKAQAAMVLDALFAADIANWQALEISTILAYLRLSEIAIGESIVRRGLFDLARLGVLATRKIITQRKGRPMWEYRLGSVESIAIILGVKLHRDENRDPIPFTSFKSVRAYRAAKHYAFLKRLRVSQLSRRKLGARLGVQGRSTFNYELGTDIEVTQRVERDKMSFADIASAPEKRLNQNVFLEVGDRVYMPYTQFILRRELERGNTVFKVKQITNEYLVA